MELNPDFWRRCSSCKAPIKYSASYYVCSVSTCNRKRIGYVFDSVHCWERHLPGARHKDAAAVEAHAPTYEQWKAELGDDASAVAAARSPQRVIARPTGAASGALGGAKPAYKDSLESEILVVVSKMKNYVKERADMSTSDSVATVLSDKIRRLCDRAIENARADGRKTVMDRDFR
jgi:histone H3/H4